MDVLSMSVCVEAVVRAFQDAAGLVRQIKEKMDPGSAEQGWEQQINELEGSLGLGSPVVQGQYDSDFRKFGETYARGDVVAREQLKDVLITLQMAISSNLNDVWMGMRPLDYTKLRIASDDSRVNAVLCLAQWQQRLSSAAAAQRQNLKPYQPASDSRPMTPPSTNVGSCSDQSSPGSATPINFGDTSVPSTCASSQTGGDRGDVEKPSPLFPGREPSLGARRSLMPSDFREIPVRSPLRPAIATSSQPPQSQILTDSFGPTPPSSRSATGPDNEHSAAIWGVRQHSASARGSHHAPISRQEIPSPITFPQSPSLTSTTTQSPTPTSRTSLPLPLTLPSDSNSYLGFCKGAFKLQIGLPPKKAFTVETRPCGLYSVSQVWRCTKCRFEGPLSLTAGLPGCGRRAGKPERTFDPRVRTSEGGITYRWAFLAKSHVLTKERVNEIKDGSFGLFGCLFCAAEGLGRGWTVKEQQVKPPTVAAAAGGRWRKTAGCNGGNNGGNNGTPMFGNLESLMQHLEMHRTVQGTPGAEMQGRTKCVVGRVAELDEDFDINLPPLDG